MSKRFKNKTFIMALIAMVLSIANQVGGMFGVDLTVYNDQITELAESILLLLGLLGVIIDPTTDGITDNEKGEDK